MNKLLGMAASLAAALLLAGNASAQGKKGFGKGGGGPLMLLMNKDVQADLKLSDDQITKIKELADKQQEAFKEAGNIDDKEERGKKFKELRDEAKKTVDDTLNADQTKRLQQLQIQQQGAGALFNPKVSQKLDLTQDQQEKVKELFKEFFPKMKEIFPLFKEDKEAATKKMDELRKSLLADAMKILNDDQKKTFEEMRGPAFNGTLPPGGFGFGMGMGMGGGNVGLRIEAAADRVRRMRLST